MVWLYIAFSFALLSLVAAIWLVLSDDRHTTGFGMWSLFDLLLLQGVMSLLMAYAKGVAAIMGNRKNKMVLPTIIFTATLMVSIYSFTQV